MKNPRLSWKMSGTSTTTSCNDRDSTLISIIVSKDLVPQLSTSTLEILPVRNPLLLSSIRKPGALPFENAVHPLDFQLGLLSLFGQTHWINAVIPLKQSAEQLHTFLACLIGSHHLDKTAS